MSMMSLLMGAMPAVILGAAPATPDLFEVGQQLWKPVADEVYLQEAGEKVVTDQPLLSLGLFGDTLYGLLQGRVRVLRDGALVPVPEAPQDVHKLQSLGGAVWAMAKSGIYRFTGDTWDLVDDQVYVDMCMHAGAVHAATRDDVYRYEDGAFVCIQPAGGYLPNDWTVTMADGTMVISDPVRIGPLDHIASYGRTLYALRPGRLILFDGKVVNGNVLDWGTLPSPRTRDLYAHGSALYVATDKGVGVMRGMAMTHLTGAEGLPYEDTTCLAPGFDEDLWIGTTTGAIRQVGDDYHYFGAHHWLPGDNVHDIVTGDRVVYIATDAGLGIIRYEPYTLQKKAAYFERFIDEWGMKRLGFIHKLYWGGDEKGWIREVSDNDGGHTSAYLAAMSFKYAATGDKAARAAAVDSFKSMAWMEEITPIPGFIARAIYSTTGDADSMSKHGSGGLPAKWYPTDDGLWYWKGDTSSDEVIGHFFSVSIFHDLAAKGPEKKRAAQHLARMASHIIDNGWVLRDMDGQPTRWGRWDPEYLHRPYGYADRGINSLEAQAFMRAANGVTGDQKFEDGFQQLMEWRYDRHILRQRKVFPPENVVPWDDHHAFRSYYTLFRYLDGVSPHLKSTYYRSLERTWEVKRIERLGWYNFTYGAITGNDCEAGQAVGTLREWPLDLRNHSYQNSHRADLAQRPGYVPYGPGTRAMSPRETEAQRGGCNMMRYDGGGGGRAVCEPTRWLADYWMGRYHGMVEAPTVKDDDLTTVKHRPGTQLGARPYEGPGRPEISME
jgi:hypothetical protein